jgi:hypothetical protein
MKLMLWLSVVEAHRPGCQIHYSMRPRLMSSECEVVAGAASCQLTACSFGWWLMAGAGLFGEKNTAGWLLVAGLF